MRFAAAILLILMCLDLGMDLWQGELGDSDSAEAVLSIAGSPEVVTISSGEPHSDSKDFVHECFCCCSHLETQGPPIVSIVFESSAAYSETSPQSLDPDRADIYHPPQHI
jgi:hypothetical protein